MKLINKIFYKNETEKELRSFWMFIGFVLAMPLVVALLIIGTISIANKKINLIVPESYKHKDE